MSFMKLRIFLFTVLSPLVLVGCESAGGGPAVPIPLMRFNCTSAPCMGVVGNRNATIVITLSGCANDQQGFELVATSAVTAFCSGGGCTGQTGTWLDANGNVAANIAGRDYNICGSIDVDNDALDINDAFAALLDTSVVGVSNLNINVWNGSFRTYGKTAQSL